MSSAEQIRRDTFAEVAAALAEHADLFERDGSDPCRVRICRELARAHALYAEGKGEPYGHARRTSGRDDAGVSR